MTIRLEILLSGFFGRGNCGDEAILQVQYECLKDHFDCVISVDHHDAYDGFWNWYPYNKCRLIHPSDLALDRYRRLRVMHVGGGGLPLSFNAAQVLSARLAGIPVAMTGTDIASATQYLKAREAKNYLEWFSYLAPRTRLSVERLTSLGVYAKLGADWACLLGTDDIGDSMATGQVLVVLRELPKHAMPHDYYMNVKKLLEKIEASTGLGVRLLPFCPEDERFLLSPKNLGEWPVLRHWWNPRRVQRLIADAQLVISIGRLHPLIMAANTKTPAIYIEPRPQSLSSQAATKVRDMLSELAFTYYQSFEYASRQIDSLGVAAAPPAWLDGPAPSQQVERQLKWLFTIADNG